MRSMKYEGWGYICIGEIFTYVWDVFTLGYVYVGVAGYMKLGDRRLGGRHSACEKQCA